MPIVNDELGNKLRLIEDGKKTVLLIEPTINAVLNNFPSLKSTVDDAYIYIARGFFSLSDKLKHLISYITYDTEFIKISASSEKKLIVIAVCGDLLYEAAKAIADALAREYEQFREISIEEC